MLTDRKNPLELSGAFYTLCWLHPFTKFRPGFVFSGRTKLLSAEALILTFTIPFYWRLSYLFFSLKGRAGSIVLPFTKLRYNRYPFLPLLVKLP